MGNADSSQCVVVEVFDAELRCRIHKVVLDSVQSATLRKHLGKEPAGRFRETLSSAQEQVLNRLALLSSIQAGDGARYFVARNWDARDSLSYDIHGDRELIMMLNGQKPMAFFVVEQGLAFEDLCEQPFGKFVAEGRIVSNAFEIDVAIGGRVNRLTYVVFTVPGEEWRFHSLRCVKTVAQKVKWNEALERLEGVLLGYTEEQCDEHISRTT